MAQPERKAKGKPSPYTADRGIPGAYEGETITRRRLFEGGALATGGIATALFSLPVLTFAVAPVLKDDTDESFQDVGFEDEFNPDTYVPKVITVVSGIGDAGKTTIYIRRFDPKRDEPVKGGDEAGNRYIAVSTRCTHLGCPVRYIEASERFVCPCHGGVYQFDGKVTGGPPVRPLDRFETRVARGRVLVGQRFSLNSKLERHAPRDPTNHLDGLWQYLYPPRPTT